LIRGEAESNLLGWVGGQQGDVLSREQPGGAHETENATARRHPDPTPKCSGNTAIPRLLLGDRGAGGYFSSKRMDVAQDK